MSSEFPAIELIDVMDEAVNYNRHLVREIVRFGRSARSVLDFGAGSGRFCGALRELGYDVHGVEPDGRLRALIEARGVPVYASLEDLGDRRFDYAFSINVLEHIEDDRAILEQIYRRLHPGGRLLVYVPAFDFLYSTNDARVGHVRRYSRAGILELARSVGFERADARYADSVGFLAAFLYRWLGSRSGDLTAGGVRLYDRVLFPVSRALDPLFHRVGGKNLLLRACRPAETGAP